MDGHRVVLAERVPFLETAIYKDAVFKLSWPTFSRRYNHFLNDSTDKYFLKLIYTLL